MELKMYAWVFNIYDKPTLEYSNNHMLQIAAH